MTTSFFLWLATQFVLLLHSSGCRGRGQVGQHIVESSGFSRFHRVPNSKHTPVEKQQFMNSMIAKRF